MSRCSCTGSSASVAKRSGDIVLIIGGKDEEFATGELLDFSVPPSLNGVHVTAINSAVSQTGSGPNVLNVFRVRSGPPVDILSTPSTIDSGNTYSYSAATPSVVDVAYRTLLTGDFLRVHVDTAATGAAGLQVIISYLEP